jgi:protein tyrosine phosphatase (PTP) superfamily phosphohydrolase (DUF442 family)
VKRIKIIVVGFAVASVISGILIVDAVLSTHAGRNAAVAPDPAAVERSRNAAIRTSLPLYHMVNEGYRRGSEPAHGGIETLINLGVRSVVDLRSSYDHNNEEIKIAAERAGLGYYRLPLSVFDPPSDAETDEFISLVTDRSKGPFFVFCADGIHRTGEMTAIYRMVNDNWDVVRALKEMDEMGFSPYYYSLRNYVWRYARKYRPEALPATQAQPSN